MKKKLMMVAVLLGALSLGACVDDNESQSVTDLRGAKAEQLRAAAELDRAKAAAEEVLAAAQADFLAAKAEFERAQAAESEQRAEEAAARFAIEIQQLEAKLQLTLLDLQNRIADAEREIVNDQNTQINTLFAAYKTAMNDLIWYNSELSKTQASIAYLEAGVEYAKSYAATQVTYYTQQIASYEAQMEVLEDPAYTNMDRTELWANYQAADKKATLAVQTVKANEGAALKAAGDEVKAAWDAMNIDAVNEINTLIYNAYITDQYGYQINTVIDPDYSQFVYVQYAATIDGTYYGLGYLYGNYRVIENNKLLADRYFAEQVENQAAWLGKDTDTAAGTAYGNLAVANKALTDANALPETTDAEKTAKEKAIKAAEEQVAQAKDNLASAKTNYDKAVATQKEYTDALAAVDVDALNTAAAAVQTALDAQEAADDAYWEAYTAGVAEINAECDALLALYSNATNISEQIEDLQKDIDFAEREIAYYSTDGSYLNNQEVALEEANQKIENLKEQIEIQKTIVDAAKAALDDAIANSEYAPSEDQPAA